MDFFAPDDHAFAVAAMLVHVDPADRALLGTLRGRAGGMVLPQTHLTAGSAI